MGKVRLVLLAVLVLAPALYSFITVEGVRDTYLEDCPNDIASVKNRNAIPAKERNDWITAVGAFQKQTDSLLTWAIALAGGIVAIITTKSLHRFRKRQLLYLILAPALAYAAGSIYSALVFQRRLTFLQVNNCLSFATLNKLLLVQVTLFEWSIAILALFTLWCFLELVMGWVDFDGSGNKGG